MNPLISYQLGILRKMTLAKVLNFTRLFLGFHLSRISGKPIRSGMPVFMSVEPTTSCNLRCPECPSGLRAFTRPTGMLDPVFFQKIILQLKKQLHSLTFYFQGEPYLNPAFLDMVTFASSQNIYTITSTNAHFINDHSAKKTIDSGLDKLIISVDGINQDSYSKYRVGGDLERVINGTRLLVEQKKKLNSRTPYIIWQFVAFKHNAHEIALVKELGKKLGVDEVKIKTAQIYDHQSGNDLIPDEASLSRYKKNEDGSYSIKNKMLNQCWRMWQGSVITWDGKVVPCCFDKDAKYQLGDLNNNSFKEVWYSKPYMNFRRSVLTARSNIDICTNCTEGTEVWA